MQALSRRIFILILGAVFLLAAAGGGLAYSYLSKAFAEADLKELAIGLQTDPVVNKPASYILSAPDKALLAESLRSLSPTELTSVAASRQYTMQVQNRWRFSRQYTIYFAGDNTVLLQDDQSRVFKVENADFFYSHDGFRHIYAERFMPVVRVTLNNAALVFKRVEEQWSYLKYNDQWGVQTPDPGNAPVVSGHPDNNDLPVNSASDRLSVEVGKSPDLSRLKITNDDTGQAVTAEPVDLSNLPHPPTNGKFSYELTMEWTDPSKPYKGKYVITIPVSASLPEKFEFSRQTVVQGDMLEVAVRYVENPDDIIFEQSLFKGFRWYQQDGLITGYIPTNYSTKPGRYTLKCGNRKTGTEYTHEIQIVAHDYHIQHLTIDKQTEQETRNDAAYAEYAKYFTPVRQQSSPERYYSESFVWPTLGRLSTEFGQTRYVNGSPTSSRHSGLDIAAPSGTAVKATNRGRVVLAMPLILTGNTVVIDHGQGLFSVYYHLDEILISDGQMAERGQKIGTVGSTGFSTGPHLHFTMSYYAINLEPGFFVAGEPVTLTNYKRCMQE